MTHPTLHGLRTRRPWRWVGSIGLLVALALVPPWEAMLADHLPLEMHPQALLPQREFVDPAPGAGACGDVAAAAPRPAGAGR